MEELIKKAVNEAAKAFNNRFQPDHLKVVEITINEFKPSKLHEFLTKNNIPNSAYFKISDYPNLSIVYEECIINEENLKFEKILDKYVQEELLNNNYYFKKPSPGIRKEAERFSIYEMYKDFNYKGLTSYYSCFYIKK